MASRRASSSSRAEEAIQARALQVAGRPVHPAGRPHGRHARHRLRGRGPVVSPRAVLRPCRPRRPRHRHRRGLAVRSGQGARAVRVPRRRGLRARPTNRGDGEDDEGPARKGLRLGLGLTLVCATTVGLLFLDRPDGPWNRGGGAVGAAVGAPLRAGLGTTGAVIVLVVLGLLGVLLLVGTGLRQVAHACAVGGRFVARHARAPRSRCRRRRTPSPRSSPGPSRRHPRCSTNSRRRPPSSSIS